MKLFIAIDLPFLVQNKLFILFKKYFDFTIIVIIKNLLVCISFKNIPFQMTNVFYLKLEASFHLLVNRERSGITDTPRQTSALKKGR